MRPPIVQLERRAHTKQILSPPELYSSNTMSNNTIPTLTNDNKPAIITKEKLVTIHAELEEMACALKCPLCLHTLQEAAMLPCQHSFCYGCISKHIQTNVNRNKVSSKCPICKDKCTRRSIRRCEGLTNLVTGFKECIKAFGLAPFQYEPAYMEMTQIVMSSQEEDTKMGKKELVALPRRSRLSRCHEHLGVSRAMNHALVSAGSRVKRLKRAAKEQEKVIQYDERALVQAAVAKRRESFENNKKEELLDSQKTGDIVDDDYDYDRKPAAVVDVTKRKNVQQNDDHNLSDDDDRKPAAILNDSRNDDQGKKKCSNQEYDKQPSAVGQDNESMKNLYPTGPGKHGLTHKNVSIHVLNDANKSTARTEEEPEFYSAREKTTQEMDEELFGQPAFAPKSDRSSVTSATPKKKLDKAVNNNKLLPSKVSDVPASASSAIKMSAQTEPASPAATEKLHETPARNRASPSYVHQQSTKSQLESPLNRSKIFEVGAIVRVQSRTWPGVNKLGGVAKIVRRHYFSANGDLSPSSQAVYDVSYILGGKEKDVDACFLNLHEDNENMSPGDSQKLASPGSRRSRRNAGKENDTPPKQPDLPKKRKSPEVELKARKKKGSAKTKKEQNDQGVGGNVNSDSNSQSSTTSKKKTAKKTNTCKVRNKSTSMTSVSTRLKNDDADIETILSLADEYYADRIERHMKGGAINILMSGLNEVDMGLVEVFVSEMKGLGVKIKLNGNFKVSKTTICLASLSHKLEFKSLGVSQIRSLKNMRSNLVGVPIVTLGWISSCLEQKKVVPPSREFCIRTLQTKVPIWMSENECEGPSARYGVARVAAHLRKLQMLSKGSRKRQVTSFQFMSNVHVLLCGQWKKGYGPKQADVETLLRDCGAQVASSASQFINSLSERRISTDNADKSFIIICDESKANGQSGLSGNLQLEVELVCANEDANAYLKVVNSGYLFDCVSCTEFIDARESQYAPSAPIAHKVWSKLSSML